jgi:hypothetical protein
VLLLFRHSTPSQDLLPPSAFEGGGSHILAMMKATTTTITD